VCVCDVLQIVVLESVEFFWEAAASVKLISFMQATHQSGNSCSLKLVVNFWKSVDLLWKLQDPPTKNIHPLRRNEIHDDLVSCSWSFHPLKLQKCQFRKFLSVRKFGDFWCPKNVCYRLGPGDLLIMSVQLSFSLRVVSSCVSCMVLVVSVQRACTLCKC